MKLMPGLGVLCQLFTSGCPLSEYFGQSCQTHSSNDIYLTYFPLKLQLFHLEKI